MYIVNKAIITEIKAFALLSIVLVRSLSLAYSSNETSNKMDAEGYLFCITAFLAFTFLFVFTRLFNISHPFVLKMHSIIKFKPRKPRFRKAFGVFSFYSHSVRYNVIYVVSPDFKLIFPLSPLKIF